MITSLTDKLGFVKIPKNASSSIAKWMHVNCEQTVGQLPGHHTIASVEVLEGVKTFCFIRDPAERFVSACRWLMRGGNQSEVETTFGDYLKGIGDESQVAQALFVDQRVRNYLHFRSQSYWISINGKVSVDYLFSYRNDSVWMSGVLSGLMKRDVSLPRINVSKTRSQSSQLTLSAQESIKEFYIEDYQLIEEHKLNSNER